MLKRSSADVDRGENGSAIHKAESFATTPKPTPDGALSPFIGRKVAACPDFWEGDW